MLPEDWQNRMERATLEGVVTRSPTLLPFIAEALDDAQRELDQTEEALCDAFLAFQKSLAKGG